PLYIMGFREYDRRRGRRRPAMWAFQCSFQTVAIPVLALVLGFVPLGASVSTLSDKIVAVVPPAISRLLHAPQDEADRAGPSYESAADPLVRKPPAPGPAAAPRVPTRKPPTRPPAPTPSASTKDAKFLTKRRFESTWRGITSNKAVVSVTLADLKRAFKDNSRAASAQYKGIPIVVRAYVGRRRLGEGGAPAVFLHRSRSADADPQVCEFPPRLATHVAKLRAGQEIIVWGALKERFFIPFIDSTAFAAAIGRR
ncbi:MAG: hypothetical protein QGD94_01520, partial [Planctomycetia bacterium]|nr:hypothetical protein [Planctomycetia bacterium]